MNEQAPRYDCGWRLPPHVQAVIGAKLKEFAPKNEKERRDKKILLYAFIYNMNAAAIARTGEFVSFAPRNKGEVIGPRGIRHIIYSYFPEVKEREEIEKRKKQKVRNESHTAGTEQGINRPVVCACCGSNENIHLHHIVPVALGGTSEYYNLVNLCSACHKKIHANIYASFEKKEDQNENHT